jgi:hypothetical protein
MAALVNYTDPRYSDLARIAEAAHHLPTGLLDAIRMLGERSNANQVSPANARSVYQFIPSTRRGVLKNYGVDAYSGPEGATEAAATLLEENLKRSGGNVPDAVSMYHGGLKRSNWGPVTRAYTDRVVGGLNMPGPSRFPYDPYSQGPDPLAPLPGNNQLAPERPTQPTPVPGDAGPSVSAPSASPIASHKRGGLLGSIGRALGSVFMPDPDSLYAAALRGGVWDAKANQRAYKTKEMADVTEQAMNEAKLKNYLTKGEYQVVGNNVFHIPPNGQPEIITPPATPSEHERLIDAWRREADPQVKDLMERLLLGGNSDVALHSKERQAATRAGATVQSATIRANAPSKSATSTKPPAGFILDQ